MKSFRQIYKWYLIGYLISVLIVLLVYLKDYLFLDHVYYADISNLHRTCGISAIPFGISFYLFYQVTKINNN
jgi:D-alanyl-lipoteichoic acid acyltransferase DltB (MBOAT superfamily)